MDKKKIRRKELLKGPDEFMTLSEKAVHFVSEHSKVFKGGATALAAALLIYLGVTSYMNYIDKKGQTAYNKAYQEVINSLNQPPEKRDLKKAKELFDEVAKDYRFSKASRLAPPQTAYLQFQEKKYDEAISLYNAYLNEDPPAEYRDMARLAIAACHEEKGDFAKAIEILQGITSTPSSLCKEEAMLSLARVYRLANQNEKAKETLEKFLETFQNSPFLPLAKAYLAEFS
jgi:outer membrane protein assembly factor BamD (BamD/ComL family)